ncbi:MAG: 5-methyltetrahydropteroyltriglutamate--homocysteine S-methyltransferase [Candidatus Andeanibacterium colombiense]|uniref:5-methyltetrahydropteroyltriglutamate--homocysteine S-methyltransferase n=1 Tax=Candidatus Andeanibacterium colombiense TaxID=3121345 RepID=A0AAJ5X9F1_9SPHN|nr:MAG: 5-methyltetrahydropteroyltriglutamate--homocysteine S-methyltransferase [Sphingomonadaceae bacterium]
MSKPIRADQVGSLLRPADLLASRREFEAGKISGGELRSREDAAILDVLALQESAGIAVFSDGEFRRSAWGNGVIDSLSGLVPTVKRGGGQAARRWQGAHSDVAEETVPRHYVAAGKIGLKHRFAHDEAKFLKDNAAGTFKITMPSPSMFTRLYDTEVSTSAYGSMDELLDDLVELYLGEIDGLHELGVPYLQLDSLRYIDTIDAVAKGSMKAEAARGTLRRLVDIDNRVLGRMKHPGVTRGVHICRGNHRSAWGAEGSYESVAEFLLGEVDTDRFLMEFDTERAGTFEPLRFVPGDKMVVLGLITTKSGELEDVDDVCRRIDEATKFIPLERLAISPQCGFASTELGNLLTVEEEKKKLALVVEVARKVWG